jgi:hypothetical protein
LNPSPAPRAEAATSHRDQYQLAPPLPYADITTIARRDVAATARSSSLFRRLLATFRTRRSLLSSKPMRETPCYRPVSSASTASINARADWTRSSASSSTTTFAIRRLVAPRQVRSA